MIKKILVLAVALALAGCITGCANEPDLKEVSTQSNQSQPSSASTVANQDQDYLDFELLDAMLSPEMYQITLDSVKNDSNYEEDKSSILTDYGYLTYIDKKSYTLFGGQATLEHHFKKEDGLNWGVFVSIKSSDSRSVLQSCAQYLKIKCTLEEGTLKRSANKSVSLKSAEQVLKEISSGSEILACSTYWHKDGIYISLDYDAPNILSVSTSKR